MAESKNPKIARWRKVQRYWGRVLDRAMDRGAYKVARRARRKRSWLTRKIRHERHVKAIRPSSKGLVWFDGVKCYAWIAAELSKARAAGRWKGHLVSGHREPWYSRLLCLRICGRDHCPGLCAGVTSNHSKLPAEYPNGAADVTDYITLQAECRRLGLRIHNDLPRDRVHFSATGK